MTARNPMIAKTHIARKDLGLDEETYRSILTRVAGLDSTAKMSDAQISAVLDEFKRLGWKPKTGVSKGAARGAQDRMIRGMWIELGKAGHLKDRSEKALRAWIRNQVAVDDLRFCNVAQKRKLIEQLKRWTARVADVQP